MNVQLRSTQLRTEMHEGSSATADTVQRTNCRHKRIGQARDDVLRAKS